MPTVLVVGLGNPGAKYDQTRHNVGWMLVERLAKRFGVELAENSAFKGYYGEARVKGSRLALLKPMTFMNLSGQAAAPAMAKLKISLESVICAADEIQLDTGRLKLSSGGSDGGHNGLTSMISELGGDGFRRLRIGVGPYRKESEPDGMVGFVLSRFGEDQIELLEETLNLASKAIEEWLLQGGDKAAFVKATSFANAKARQPLLQREAAEKAARAEAENAKKADEEEAGSTEPTTPTEAEADVPKSFVARMKAHFGHGAKGPETE